MKNTLNLIILPLYRIENDYSFSIYNCLNNTESTLSLEWLEKILSKLFYKFNISQISIEGGEISLLSDIYFDLLFKLLKIYTKKISISTDFINFKQSLINDVNTINVLYNFNINSDIVYKNIKAATSIQKNINVKSIDYFVNDNYLNKIHILNKLKIKSWEIIPYQKTKNNNLEYSKDLYKNTIDNYLKYLDNMQFNFINTNTKTNIIESIYITPNNKLGLGKLNSNNEFFIEEYDSLDELEKNL